MDIENQNQDNNLRMKYSNRASSYYKCPTNDF